MLVQTSHLPMELLLGHCLPGGRRAFLLHRYGLGTFGLFIPIVVFICQNATPEIMTVTLSATLAGAVFGDHCSPISDTTILSSSGAGCNHMQHVSTQIPYACLVAACCFVSYLVAGFSGGSALLTLLSGIILLMGALLVLHKESAGRMESLKKWCRSCGTTF